MAYLHRVTVRYGETDQMGFAHHANYLLYLEEARTNMMASLGHPYGELETKGVGLPVRQASLRYRSPARYEDLLEVEVRVGRVGHASVTFEYRIVRPLDGVLIARATVELAAIAMDGTGLCTLPDDLRAALEGAQEAAGDPA